MHRLAQASTVLKYCAVLDLCQGGKLLLQHKCFRSLPLKNTIQVFCIYIHEVICFQFTCYFAYSQAAVNPSVSVYWVCEAFYCKVSSGLHFCIYACKPRVHVFKVSYKGMLKVCLWVTWLLFLQNIFFSAVIVKYNSFCCNKLQVEWAFVCILILIQCSHLCLSCCLSSLYIHQIAKVLVKLWHIRLFALFIPARRLIGFHLLFVFNIAVHLFRSSSRSPLGS